MGRLVHIQEIVDLDLASLHRAEGAKGEGAASPPELQMTGLRSRNSPT